MMKNDSCLQKCTVTDGRLTCTSGSAYASGMKERKDSCVTTEDLQQIRILAMSDMIVTMSDDLRSALECLAVSQRRNAVLAEENRRLVASLS
jgi:hypothetical protein